MDKNNCRILVVDDEPELLELVTELLYAEGYVLLEKATNCSEAENKIRKNGIDLVLLDVMLPDGNGFNLYKKLKSEGFFPDIPVIFLSARDEDTARLKGLGLGADDYVTKPFLPKELVFRIAAVLRRIYRLSEQENVVRLGNTEVFLDAGIVKRADAEYSLTAKEHALLTALAENRGKIVTTDVLCDVMWPDGSYGLESSLIVHMRHLREKIEENPSKPCYLITVRGLGYRLEKDK